MPMSPAAPCVAALFLAACGPPPGTPPTTTPGGPPITGYAAYLRRDGSVTAPWLAWLDGSERRDLGSRIASHAFVDFEASPDGRTLAIVSGELGQSLHLQVYDVESDTIADAVGPLVGASDPRIVWTSDSSSFLFWSQTPGSTGHRFVSADGASVEWLTGEPVGLTNGGSQASVSEHDAAFFFRLGTGAPAFVDKPRVYDATADFVELTGTAVVTWDWSPGVFAFIEQPGDALETRLVRFDLVTQSVVPLTASTGVLERVVSDPTGRYVAYLENQYDDDLQVIDDEWFRLDLDAGGAPLPLTDLDTAAGSDVLAWSPSGAHVAIVERHAPDLATLSVVDEFGQRVDATPGGAAGALVVDTAWSPDGRFVAFATLPSTPGGAWRTHVHDTQSAATIEIVDLPGEDRDLRPLAWAPDASSLLMAADDGATDEVVRWQLASATPLTTPFASDVAPTGERAAFSADGTRWVWVEQTTGGMGVRVTDPTDPSTSTLISTDAGLADADQVTTLQVR